MSTNEHDISVLNDLIEVTLDSAHGYTDAVQDTKNSQFKTLFGKRGMERKQVAAELQTEVRRLLGGEPAKEGTTLGKLHRTVMNLKASLTGSDTGIVNSVESGEDHIKAEYEKALADTELSRPVHALIQTAYSSVLAGHNEMRTLKQLLHS
jgi:uncharacterized protein (TIGR02284 family)